MQPDGLIELLGRERAVFSLNGSVLSGLTMKDGSLFQSLTVLMKKEFVYASVQVCLCWNSDGNLYTQSLKQLKSQNKFHC